MPLYTRNPSYMEKNTIRENEISSILGEFEQHITCQRSMSKSRTTMFLL